MPDPAHIRPLEQRDIPACGRIIYEAFNALATKHGFAPDFPNAEVATGFLKAQMAGPAWQGVVLEVEGKTIGCNFVNVGDGPVAGIGPVAVDPKLQGGGYGRKLMEAVVEQAKQKGLKSYWFCQVAYNTGSMMLYTSMGAIVRETCAVLTGKPLKERIDGFDVRPGTSEDIARCVELCDAVLGYKREVDIRSALDGGSLAVVEHNGKLTGYTCGVGFGSHTAAQDNESLKALIAAAAEFGGLGFILPMSNVEVYRWTVSKKFRLSMQVNYMTLGDWRAPKGAWMPSICVRYPY